MGATPHNREAVANGTPVWEWGRFSWGPLHHAGSTPFKKGVVGWFATSPEFNDTRQDRVELRLTIATKMAALAMTLAMGERPL